jgi:hypothetical protein
VGLTSPPRPFYSEGIRVKEAMTMFVSTSNQTILRNYLAAMISVMMLGVGITDLVNNPNRIAQQDRLDGYGRYVSAGLVSGAVKATR